MVRFRRHLAARRVAAGPTRSALAVEALHALDERSRDQVYWALRCTMVSRPEEIPEFDRAFAAFWQGTEGAAPPESREPGRDPQAADPEGGRTAEGDRRGGRDQRSGAAAGGDDDGEDADVPAVESGALASAHERLAMLDFRDYDPDDLAQARRLMARLTGGLPRRRSRRLEPTGTAGRRLNLRRTVRDSMRTEGDPLRRAWRTRKVVPRRLVFLVDVSGSMREYALPMLLFCQVVVRTGLGAEVFAFGTRLTRLTPHLRRAGAGEAVQRLARVVPDWAGGTRIGDNLKAFNDEWGRRGLTRGAVTVVVSDGWERGDVRLLEDELALLHRAGHALLWVNPLAGDPDYQPLAGGMAAALRHVDGFQAGNNLAGLEQLVARLAQIV